MARKLNYPQVIRQLKKYAQPDKAEVLQRFFKTRKGEYAEGDVFWGVMVPDIRRVAREFRDLDLKNLTRLITSHIHTQRLCGLLILVFQFQRAGKTGGREGAMTRERLLKVYLRLRKYINNWDLVDLTAPHVLGASLNEKNKVIIYKLARSKSLWDRRIAIISTFALIRINEFSDTLRISEILLGDQEDLIHKAVGWMLREVGKRDQVVEEKFLRIHYEKMPRTMLRYAIERFPEKRRKEYLLGKV